jgi:hypothetical protein
MGLAGPRHGAERPAARVGGDGGGAGCSGPRCVPQSPAARVAPRPGAPGAPSNYAAASGLALWKIG